MYNDLTRCNQHLLVVLKIRDDLEDIFGLILLFQTVFSMLIIASNLFVASKVPITSPEFLSQMQYCCNVILQLFLFCYFGNELCVSSEQINKALYDSNWYSASPRYKRSIILTMCRMQKIMYVTTGKFSPLTLASFVSVVKHSFSYLALFQNM
nr:unnamed protein product [Callosobruchus chinensis]